jgi:hypothetical protein
MTEVQSTASLHERAVQKVATDELELPTRSRSPRRVLHTSTRSVRVHPAVIDAAHRAMRPGQRLVIVSETEVRIINS